MGADPKPGSKRYRERLRSRLADLGFDEEQIAAQVCADLIRACRMRPREAWRLARELSLDEVAARYNAVLGDPAAPMRKGRIWDYEQWPHRGARPTIPALKILAQLYGTGWTDLVDIDDLAQMPGKDRRDYHDAIADTATAERRSERKQLETVAPRRPERRPAAGDASHGHTASDNGVSEAVEREEWVDAGAGRSAERRADQRQPALHQLPPDIPDFTGRDDQVAEIARMVGSGETAGAVAVSVISGKPGVGKTSLALRVAHRVGDRFPGGQLYVNLRGAEPGPLEPAEALAAFLRELGIEGTAIPDREEDRARMYRARLADRRMLVVLDNAADEAQVRPLLPGNPDCAVIVTSRSPLAGLSGAHTVALDVMPAGQSVALLTAIIGGDRARKERDALADITQLCGHLPLAIRIAGARLLSRPAWRLSWFADRLRDERRRLDLLKAGDMDVRTTFALSYEGRDPAEQRAFRLLGAIKAGDFTAWNLAALAGTGPDEAERVMEDLVDAGLVEVAGVDRTGCIRYRFHDLLRAFARECFIENEPEEEQRAAVARLVDAYAAMTHMASVLLQPGALEKNPAPPQPQAAEIVSGDPRSWFRSERASLVAAVDLAYEAGLWDRTWQLARYLTVLFDWSADFRNWEHTHTLALDAAVRASSQRGEAFSRRSLGTLYRELGRYDEAAAMLTQAADLFAHAGDQHARATVLRHLGDTCRYQGKLEDALACFTEALEIFSRFEDERSAAAALSGMGDACRGLSRWKEATASFERSIQTYRDLGDSFEHARSTLRHALVFRDRCQHALAAGLLEESLSVFSGLGDRRWQARALRHLGVIHRNSGDLRTALSLFGKCLPIFDDLADRRAIAVTLRNRADAFRRLEDWDAAATDLNDAYKIFEDIGDRRWCARTRLSMAGIHRCQLRYEEAAACTREALEAFEAIGDRPAQARALHELGMILRGQYLPEAAGKALAESQSIFEDLGDELWTARVLASRARIEDSADATRWHDQAVAICERNNIAPSEIANVLSEW